MREIDFENIDYSNLKTKKDNRVKHKTISNRTQEKINDNGYPSTGPLVMQILEDAINNGTFYMDDDEYDAYIAKNKTCNDKVNTINTYNQNKKVLIASLTISLFVISLISICFFKKIFCRYLLGLSIFFLTLIGCFFEIKRNIKHIFFVANMQLVINYILIVANFIFRLLFINELLILYYFIQISILTIAIFSDIKKNRYEIIITKKFYIIFYLLAFIFVSIIILLDVI